MTPLRPAQALAKNLNEGLKYTNELSQLFAQNGSSLRDQSGAAKGLVDILAKGADFVRNARTEQDKFLITQQMGLSPTAEMVKFLEQGGTAIKLAMEDAKLAGAVIDEHLVRSAQAFDERWTVAMTNISLRVRAWLADTQDGLQKVADSSVWGKIASASVRVASGLPIVGVPIMGARAIYDLTRSPAGAPQSTSPADNPQRRLEGSFSLTTAENDRVASANRTKLTADTQKLMGLESQRIGLLGGMASISDTVRAKEIEIAQARLNGLSRSPIERRSR